MRKFEGKWLPSATEYKKACIEISRDLKGFKRNNIYARIIANDLRDEKIATGFYDFIKRNYPYLLEKDVLNNFLINDKIGDPNIFNINGVGISPGTLRFMKVLGDILTIDENMKDFIEIGSGYGGQCLIIKTYRSNCNYTLIDIPESLMVSGRYLKENGCDATLISTDDVAVNDVYDIAISDYCLSELDSMGMEFYMKNVIGKCKYAYITANSLGAWFNILIKQLETVFNTVQVNAETPKTTNNNNHIIVCKNNRYLNDK
jgi:hypothetical protein